MELRTYQLEVLAKIREFKSTVAFMPTGSGKTLVAVWLLRERIALQQRDVADGQAKKVCVFSAPNKVLCHQQADYIGSNIGDDQRCRIRVLTGETPRIDNWCGTEWKDILASVEVIVCVPEILRRALACNFVDSNLIDTLIFDECHHCVSKKGVSSGHPYCQLAQLARGARKYVGLTASPINCKKVDVKKNMQQLKTVLSLNGECEIVRPSATLAELQEYVHTPEPQLELYASPVYRPNCDRFDDCKAKGQRLHDLMCGAYKRVSWLDEYCAIRKSLRHVDANYTAVVGLVSANLMDLPHNEVSYYCELLGQLGKVLHEGGSRAALHALKYICRTHDEILEDYALPELYNQAEGKIEPGRLKFRIKRLEEHVAEFPLWPGTMANAVRQSLWEACEAICVYGGLELVEVAGNIDIPGVSLEDLKRYITETFVPRLLGMAVDADKLLKLRSVLQLDDLAHSKYSATIVFVGERLMARALAATLNLRYCVGGNGERVSKQTEALEWFKDTAEEGSQRAVLIATSVCDEGVDVPICDCVVMWDVPPNVRSFIQRRGRARKIRPTKSELIVLVEASNFAVTKANESLREYQRQEAQMATLADCWEDGIDSADDDSDSEIQPRVVIGREGVRISCRHAKGTLHEFASSLTATDEFFTPTPIFFGEKRDESFRATVILPSSVRPPIARWAMSRWHATKGRAIREASARQLEKLAVLPWVTPQFKNMYAVGKADGVNEDLLPPGDLLDLAAHQLTERRGDVAPALVKPTDDNSVMYAYQLRVQWHNAGMEIPERLGNWRELTRKRVAAIEKLRILTPEPLVGRVIEAVKEIPISASGLGRSDSRLGTVKVTLTPEGAVNVTGDFMNTIWAFHRQVFAKVDGGAVVDSWSQCQADRPFYIVSASTGDMVEMARILDAFQDDPRLLVEIGLTVSELARVEASPLSRTLAAVPLHLLFEALTPKQCEMMIDSEKHEPLGCALLEILASEYVWADQFDEGEAALEGKLTEERQAYVLRERVAYRGLMSTVCSAMQWRDQQSSPLPGYQVAEGAAQPVVEGAARDRTTAFLNALRTSTTSLVGVVFGEAGWRAGMALLRRLELIPEDEVGELVPHSAVGGRAEVEAMGLPQDIPPMVRDYLLRPPVTYDTLLIANGLNVPPIGGYEFRRHPWLLMEAFTHASVAAVSPSYSNERLEWIGDAVLGAVVWSKLYEEGRATLSSFIDYTCNFHLARVAVLKLGAQNRINVLSVALQSAIGRYVRELHHDEQPVPKGPKALADCVEAIIGAIWLDAGGSTGEGWDAAARFIRDNVFSLELAERRPAPRGGPGDDGPPEGRRRRRARRRRIPGLQADDSGGQTPSTSSSTPARTRAHLNRNDQAVFVRDLVARLGNVEELLRQLPGS